MELQKIILQNDWYNLKLNDCLDVNDKADEYIKVLEELNKSLETKNALLEKGNEIENKLHQIDLQMIKDNAKIKSKRNFITGIGLGAGGTALVILIIKILLK